MDCSPLSSFVLGIFQSRILGWVSTFKKTPGDLLDPGIEHESLVSPALAGKFFTLLLPGKPHEYEWQPFNKCWLLFCYYMEVRLVLKKLKMKKIIKIMQIGFPDGSDGKEYACNARHPGLIPGSGRSLGEGNGNPPQYLAWRIPWTERRLVGYSPWSHKESDTTEQWNTHELLQHLYHSGSGFIIFV